MVKKQAPGRLAHHSLDSRYPV